MVFIMNSIVYFSNAMNLPLYKGTADFSLTQFINANFTVVYDIING